MLQIRFRPSWALFLILIGSGAVFVVVGALCIVRKRRATGSAWAPNTAYAVGAQVTYQGVLYQCRYATLHS